MTTAPDPDRSQPPPATEPGEWALWADWCAATGRSPLPLTVQSVLEFLSDCPAALATLTRRVRAIDAAGRAAGWPALERTEDLRDVLRGRPARPVRQTVSAEQIDAALRALPSRGWVQGWFGRRDRALLVLAHTAGLSYRQIGRLTVGDITFTPDGAAQVATPAGPVTLRPNADPVLCGPCALARWIEALDQVVGFRPLIDFLEHAPLVTVDSPHVCITAVTPGAATLTTALLPPADQWGATAIEPEPLRPRSLSQLARDHAAGRHRPHRIIQRHTVYAQLPNLVVSPDATPAATAPSYTVADWQAGVDRRNADRERLADLDALLDDLDEKAKTLEWRTRELLQH